MSLLPPPRPPRRPMSISSTIDYPITMIDHSRPARCKSPTPSILVNVKSPKIGEQIAIGILLENHDEATDDEDDSVQTTPTASPTRQGQGLLQPFQHIPTHATPPPPDTDSIFAAASSLMAAVTAGRGKNMIIGPCTCRTCSVGCLVALLAMATGRVEQLREDIAVETYNPSMGKTVGRPTVPTRNPSPTVRLHEVATKLRDLVRTMAHLHLDDKECRILQASGTQFVVALPHVQVDYLRARRRVTTKKAASPEEDEANEDLDVAHDAIPTTPPLNVRKDPRRQGEARRPPRIEVPDGVCTGDFLGSAWGSFAWGAGGRSNSIRGVSAQTFRASRRVNGSNSSPKVVEEAMCMGALQVVLEAASVAPFQPARVDPLPGAASRIVMERSEIQLITPEATIGTEGNSQTHELALCPPTSAVQSRAASPPPPCASSTLPSRSPSPEPSRAPSPLPARSQAPPPPAQTPLIAWPATPPPPPRSLSPVPNRPQSPFQHIVTPPPRAHSPIPPESEVTLRPVSPVPFPSSPSWDAPTLSILTQTPLVFPSPRPTPASPPSAIAPSRAPSPIPTWSRSVSPFRSVSPTPSDVGPPLEHNAELRAANKVKAAHEAHASVDESAQLRRSLSTAQAEIEALRADRTRLEATIAELRGRLAAAETMLDTYDDLTREVETERRQLEGDKFILELENARLEKKNAQLMAKDTKGKR